MACAVLALCLANSACSDAAVPKSQCKNSGSTFGWVPEPIDPSRRVLKVGPNEELKKPSAAAAIAKDGDVILIAAGDYRGDAAVWRQTKLLIRGAPGRPRLIATGAMSEGKGIWVTKGADVTIENIEFRGARVPDRNGAGIRAEGRNLTVRNAVFNDNENGILGANDPTGKLTVEFTHFIGNGAGDGYTHNIYVGESGEFVLRYSTSVGARTGHLIKSRAHHNVIEYNLLADTPTGNASYELEFPNAGVAVVRGNLIVQSESSDNSAIVSYGAEKPATSGGSLSLEFNTIVSERSAGMYVSNSTRTVVQSASNVYAGLNRKSFKGAVQNSSDIFADKKDFADFERRQFRLRSKDVAAIAQPASGRDAVKTEPPTESMGLPSARAPGANPGALTACKPAA